MIIEISNDEPKHVHDVMEHLKNHGMDPRWIVGQAMNIVVLSHDDDKVDVDKILAMPGVMQTFPPQGPYKLTCRKHDNVVPVIHIKDDVEIQQGNLTMIAGPCAIENEKMLWDSAIACKEAGVKILRGGCFKPRTSPYDFEGLGIEGLRMLQRCGQELNMATITEVRTLAHIEPANDHVDILQVGARNMQNFDLLKALGQQQKPVMIKRGMAATIKELLLAAEYIISYGNPNVILCERGMRTFEPATRFTLDVSAIPVLKELTRLPIIVDPSHAAGKASLVPSLARAGIAAGADGFIIEVHCDPCEALCDGPQSLIPNIFMPLVKDLIDIHTIVSSRVPVAESADAPA